MNALDLLPLFGLLVLLGTVLTVLYFLRRQLSGNEAPAPSLSNTHGAAEDSSAAPDAPTIRRRRGGLSRMRRAAAAAPAEAEDNSAAGDADGDAEASASAKRSKKKDANREAKREAQQARQAALQAYHERQDAADEARAAEEALEAAESEEAAEAVRQEAEEKERKEREEYDSWKDLISVEDMGEGTEAQKLENPDLLQKFCNYVRTNKLIVLEELAAEFELKTEDVLDRLTTLEEAGTLTGFFDDRGKFIYVSMEEMADVAKFINRRGRISIHDLAMESSKLLHLDLPTAGAT